MNSFKFNLNNSNGTVIKLNEINNNSNEISAISVSEEEDDEQEEKEPEENGQIENEQEENGQDEIEQDENEQEEQLEEQEDEESSDSRELLNKEEINPYHERYVETDLESFNGKYIIISHIKDGTYSSVFKVLDIKKKKFYAMKISCVNEQHISYINKEIEILEYIKENDLFENFNCARIIDNFLFQKDNIIYNAIIEDLYGFDLYQFNIKENIGMGLPMTQIQKIAKQLLNAVDFLHSKNIIHTDITTENIILTNSKYNNLKNLEDFPCNAKCSDYIKFYYKDINKMENKIDLDKVCYIIYKKLYNSNIKLIDFGKCWKDVPYGTGLISKRFYRAPEVVLRCSIWTSKVDIWAIGCVLMELYLGDYLFQIDIGRKIRRKTYYRDEEHLALIEKLFGHYPNWMIGDIGNPRLKNIFIDCKRHKTDKVIKLNNLEDSDYIKRSLQLLNKIKYLVDKSHKVFGNFIKYIMKIDPYKRPCAKDALKHKFFKTKFID